MLQWTWTPVRPKASGEELIEQLNKRMKALENIVNQLRDRAVGTGTFTDGDTSPLVAGKGVWRTANTAPTSITAFDGGEAGEKFLLVFGDSDTDLVHGANLVLDAGVNFVGVAGNVLQFVTYDGSIWREVPTT